MKRLANLEIMLEIKRITELMRKAAMEGDVAWVEELEDEKYQLEMEIEEYRERLTIS
jgi:hypothetical protein